MGLSPGTRLGPYEIVAPLGAGGMGEVYRARDTRLGRDVAIKVLPADLTSTPEARARFEREARAISHLNHPNICTLHDVGREGEIDYLVMELVSGGSLRDRMTRKALSLEQVLDLGIQIADALEAAHARGIVHRDLKPGNVLLTERGQAKVMDFGLALVKRRGARARGEASATGASATSAASTEEEHLTSPGQAVGTVSYMSPEQARGEEVDARSDVFSLGAVLYEMASGHHAFEGSSTAVIFEAILNRDPAPVSILRPDTPPELDRILGKALEKDRELRYQTAGDVRSDLKRLKRDLESSRAAGPGSGSGSRARSAVAVTLPPSVIARRRLVRMGQIAAAIIALAGAVLVAVRFARREPPGQTMRLSLEAPPAATYMGNPRISPDGRLLAFAATDSIGVSQIWIRPMDGTSARPLPGTQGGGRPFWSPDSRYIGFVSRAGFHTIDINGGGQPTRICDAGGDFGSWGSSGMILVDSGAFDPIRVFSAAGGQATQATWLDRSRGEAGHAWPQFLPDGKHFLYLAMVTGSDSTTLRVGRLGSRESRILAVGSFSRVEYVPPGYLLYLRGRTLLAQPFSASRLRFTGDAFPVVDDAVSANPGSDADFSASGTGTLVYRDQSAEGKSRLAWLDRSGREIGTLGPTGHYWHGVTLSPDGRRAAVAIAAPGESFADVWLWDIARDVATRFTSDPGADFDPVWSADGSKIYFQSQRGAGGESRIWFKPSSGVGAEQELKMPPGRAAPGSVTQDGRCLLASASSTVGAWDMVKITLGDEPRVSSLGIHGGAQGTGFLRPMISPDARWIAYVSGESGRDEVYVVDFPGLTGKWRISADGGSLPQWRGDAKELYYLVPGETIMSVAVPAGSSFSGVAPARLFHCAGAWQYAPSPDGRRFLVCMAAKGENLPPANVVLNWPAALGRR